MMFLIANVTVTVDPETPSIIHGDVMFMNGPCLSKEIEEITCIFTDHEGDVPIVINRMPKTNINGISKDERAICPMPLFRNLGEHKLTIFVKDGSNYSGTFEVGRLSHIPTYVYNYVNSII